MTRLDIQQLHLHGTLPSELGDMSLLKDLAMDQNDLASSIPTEICALRDLRLTKFICDCPTKAGKGVGNFSADAAAVGVDQLMQMKGNCFTMCRRGA